MTWTYQCGILIWYGMNNMRYLVSNWSRIKCDEWHEIGCRELNLMQLNAMIEPIQGLVASYPSGDQVKT